MSTSPSFVKTYHLAGCAIFVTFQNQLVRIVAPEELARYLSTQIKPRSLQLATLIKTDYRIFFGKDLDISTPSIIVEIWGHLLASNFARSIKRHLNWEPICRFANFVISRSDHIDCGERRVDSNRLMWDILSPFRNALARFIPTKKQHGKPLPKR